MSLKTFSRFHKFQILGILCGGLAPVFGVFFLELFEFDPQILDPSISNFLYGFALLGILFAVIAPHVDHWLEDGSYVSQVVFSAQAIYSFFVLHILVLFSGGPHVSVFALTYIYMVAIVGYTFGKSWSLYICAFVVLMSYMSLLFNMEGNLKFFLWLFGKGPTDDGIVQVFSFPTTLPLYAKHVYAGVVLLQVSVTVLIASPSLAEDGADPKDNNEGDGTPYHD